MPEGIGRGGAGVKNGSLGPGSAMGQAVLDIRLIFEFAYLASIGQ